MGAAVPFEPVSDLPSDPCCEHPTSDHYDGLICLADGCPCVGDEMKRWAQEEAIKRVTPVLLRLEPGDVLLLQTDNYLAPEDRENYSRRLREVFPGNKVAVLDGGLKLAAVLGRA